MCAYRWRSFSAGCQAGLDRRQAVYVIQVMVSLWAIVCFNSIAIYTTDRLSAHKNHCLHKLSPEPQAGIHRLLEVCHCLADEGRMNSSVVCRL